ncbi:MAG: hypothetical protein JHC95_16020 [Solirubrobacteraceae bacterium]|nr:hypothetical protein [Solirubrobacteraceae bacterium]
MANLTEHTCSMPRETSFERGELDPAFIATEPRRHRRSGRRRGGLQIYFPQIVSSLLPAVGGPS